VTTPDRRLTPDIPAGSTGKPMRIVVPVVALRPNPVAGSGIDTELVYGQAVTCFREADGWAYLQASRDGYVGWLPVAALGQIPGTATHKIRTLRSYIYSGPSIKTADPVLIPQGSEVTVTAIEGDFARLADGGFVYGAHLMTIDAVEHDYVAVAEAYLGTPYYWGGCTSFGLDCSGLTHVALRMAGIAAPRDSDMLERFYPVSLPVTPDLTGLKRGDAVFWKGHVGIMRDAGTLLHANGHHMLVASEPLKQAAARILQKSFGPVTSIKRLG
jgi:Bacterial dipeptidyl-peptidase Sh3 domain/NlpC/P60 family